MPNTKNGMTIDELVRVSDISKRTLRFYIQQGLVDPPVGNTANARYDTGHLEQIRNIKTLQAEGYTLSRIAELNKTQSLRQSGQIKKKHPKAPGKPISKIEVPLHPQISVVFAQNESFLSEDFIKFASKKLFDSLNEALDEFETKKENPSAEDD
ncbi:MAG: helix-turn-helix domain-containing protein [Burkholderiales bacterium]|nr:helix-turn-helix domain-containing protein [Burkholderiales bacterium]